MVTKSKPIYQGENNGDVIDFFIPKEYNNNDISEALVRFDYMLPNGVTGYVLLNKDEDDYDNFSLYHFTITTIFTHFAGRVIFWLTLLKNEESVILKTSQSYFDVIESIDVTYGQNGEGDIDERLNEIQNLQEETAKQIAEVQEIMSTLDLTPITDSITDLTSRVDILEQTCVDLDNNKMDKDTANALLQEQKDTVDTLNRELGELQTEVTNLSDRLDESETTQNAETIKQLQQDITTQQQRIETIETNISTQENRLNELENNVTTLTTDTSELRTDVDDISTKVTEQAVVQQGLSEELSTQTARIDEVVDDIATHDVMISDIKSDVDTLRADTTNLTDRVDALTTSMEALDTEVGTLSDTVDGISTDVGNIQNSLDSLASDMDTVKDMATNIDNINNDINGLKEAQQQLDTRVGTLDEEKADDIQVNDDNSISLLSHGQPVGSPIKITVSIGN